MKEVSLARDRKAAQTLREEGFTGRVVLTDTSALAWHRELLG
ncbi:hypothetical protein GCM10023196_031090 [Actinoallomurus vinaceus]|uniref:Uncharacterized protein n=1 Tax=Actinoallomurus vinaceus TaxID=1080074 RepID=A0ABP8U9G9_9ACTN